MPAEDALNTMVPALIAGSAVDAVAVIVPLEAPPVYATLATYFVVCDAILRVAGNALFTAKYSETECFGADAAKITSDTFARTV